MLLSSGQATAEAQPIEQEAHTQLSLCMHPIASAPRRCPASAGAQLCCCCTPSLPYYLPFHVKLACKNSG